MISFACYPKIIPPIHILIKTIDKSVFVHKNLPVHQTGKNALARLCGRGKTFGRVIFGAARQESEKSKKKYCYWFHSLCFCKDMVFNIKQKLNGLYFLFVQV